MRRHLKLIMIPSIIADALFVICLWIIFRDNDVNLTTLPIVLYVISLLVRSVTHAIMEERARDRIAQFQMGIIGVRNALEEEVESFQHRWGTTVDSVEHSLTRIGTVLERLEEKSNVR